MNRKSSWGAVLPLVGALLYGASPLDLIPDVIPIIGLVDDAIIVPLLLVIALFQWRKIQEARKPIPVRMNR